MSTEQATFLSNHKARIRNTLSGKEEYVTARNLESARSWSGLIKGTIGKWPRAIYHFLQSLPKIEEHRHILTAINIASDICGPLKILFQGADMVIAYSYLYKVSLSILET